MALPSLNGYWIAVLCESKYLNRVWIDGITIVKWILDSGIM